VGEAEEAGIIAPRPPLFTMHMSRLAVLHRFSSFTPSFIVRTVRNLNSSRLSLCGFVVFVLFASFWRVVSGAVLVRLVVFQLLKVVAATVEEPALVVRFYL